MKRVGTLSWSKLYSLDYLLWNNILGRMIRRFPPANSISTEQSMCNHVRILLRNTGSLILNTMFLKNRYSNFVLVLPIYRLTSFDLYLLNLHCIWKQDDRRVTESSVRFYLHRVQTIAPPIKFFFLHCCFAITKHQFADIVRTSDVVPAKIIIKTIIKWILFDSHRHTKRPRLVMCVSNVARC